MIFERLRSLKKSNPKMEEDFRNNIRENGGLEKGDFKAMIIAGFITIMPIALGVLLLFALAAFLFI